MADRTVIDVPNEPPVIVSRLLPIPHSDTFLTLEGVSYTIRSVTLEIAPAGDLTLYVRLRS